LKTLLFIIDAAMPLPSGKRPARGMRYILEL